jgi:hypothetical protein
MLSMLLTVTDCQLTYQEPDELQADRGLNPTFCSVAPRTPKNTRPAKLSTKTPWATADHALVP